MTVGRPSADVYVRCSVVSNVLNSSSSRDDLGESIIQPFAYPENLGGTNLTKSYIAEVDHRTHVFSLCFSNERKEVGTTLSHDVGNLGRGRKNPSIILFAPHIPPLGTRSWENRA